MAITRATGKAFRLNYSWIMALAGYEPTPAEEMPTLDITPKKSVWDMRSKAHQSELKMFLMENEIPEDKWQQIGKSLNGKEKNFDTLRKS